LFLLLTAALAAAYYTLQWLLASFVSYYVSNYAAAHSDFQMPSWINLALIILFTVLNYGFVIMLGLTAWSAMKKVRADRAATISAVQDVCAPVAEADESAGASEGATTDTVTPEPPVIPGPEA
jgi:hypothetical protein